MATRVQIVFQGGGAKLCLLMAACDILRSYHDADRIEITRTAGSSAGAIAAAMLGSQRTIGEFKSDLAKLGPQYVAAMNFNRLQRYRARLRVAQGGAYFADIDLEGFFEKLICPGRPDMKVKDLRFDPHLYYTDLYTLESRWSEPDELVTKALAKSCRFPFAFVGYGAGNTEVDGGLALNLPVDQLTKDASTKGSVIGVSFASSYGAMGKSNLLSYTQQLFSAAIQSGVARSEAILGRQNVFPIDSKIGTFDFATALTEGLEVHFELWSGRFAKWLDAWLPRPDEHGPWLIRPVVTAHPWPAEIVRELDDRPAVDPCLHAESTHSFDVAQFDSKGNFDGTYRSRTIMKFRITRKTSVLQFTFQIGKGGTFSSANLGCTVADSTIQPLRFTPHVQELTNIGDPLRTFRVYFLFDQALDKDSPSQPYRLEYDYVCDDPYTDVGQDTEVVSLTTGQGPCDEVIVGVAFPRSKFKENPTLKDIKALSPEELGSFYTPAEQANFVASKPADLLDHLDKLRLEKAGNFYFLAGCKANNIQLNQTIGLAIEHSVPKG